MICKLQVTFFAVFCKIKAISAIGIVFLIKVAILKVNIRLYRSNQYENKKFISKNFKTLPGSVPKTIKVANASGITVFLHLIIQA